MDIHPQSGARQHRFLPRAPWAAVLSIVWMCAMVLAHRAPAAVLDPRTIQFDSLHNGLRLVVCEDPHASVASVTVVVKAGAADDPPGQSGTAHLLEHVLWTRGGTMDPRLRVERAGGAASAGTLRDFTRFCASVASDDFEVALGALSDVVVRPVLDDATVAREQRVISEEGAALREDPRAILSDLAFEAVYGEEHPYGHRIDGDEMSRSAVDAVGLRVFHSTWYVPNNMVVVVAGGVRLERARAAVASAFGHLRPAATPGRTWPMAPRPVRPAERVVDAAVERAYVMAAFVGPAASEPDAVCASDLLVTLLAHGPLGRLSQVLKGSKGLAYEAGVEFLTQRDRALFGVWAVCDAERIPAVKDAVLGELKRFAREPVAGPEFATGKRLLSAGYAFANEISTDRASTLGFYEAVGDYRGASYYLPRVRALTRTDLMRIGAWYSSRPVWVVIRPEVTQP
jgi:zinc protease